MDISTVIIHDRHSSVDISAVNIQDRHSSVDISAVNIQDRHSSVDISAVIQISLISWKNNFKHYPVCMYSVV